MRHSNGKCADGTKQVSTCLQPAVEEAVHKVQGARTRVLGWTPPLCSIFQELIGFALRYVDPSTGWLKPPSPQPAGAAPGMLPTFQSGRFENYARLVQAMNESNLMVWTCGMDMEIFHVTPMLEYYTGRPAVQFRGLGWKNILHPDDQESTLRNRSQRFQTRRPFCMDYYLQCYTGSYGRIVDAAEPWYLADGTFAGYVGTLYQFPENALVLVLGQTGEYELITRTAAKCSGIHAGDI